MLTVVLEEMLLDPHLHFFGHTVELADLCVECVQVGADVQRDVVFDLLDDFLELDDWLLNFDIFLATGVLRILKLSSVFHKLSFALLQHVMVLMHLVLQSVNFLLQRLEVVDNFLARSDL